MFFLLLKILYKKQAESKCLNKILKYTYKICFLFVINAQHFGTFKYATSLYMKAREDIKHLIM